MQAASRSATLPYEAADDYLRAVGLALFASPETGVDWGVLSAGTLLSIAPLLLAFLLFQRQFMQSFMNAGIK